MNGIFIKDMKHESQRSRDKSIFGSPDTKDEILASEGITVRQAIQALTE